MRYRFLLVLIFVLIPPWAMGAEYRISVDTTWTMPRGVISLAGDGSVELVKMRKDINAALDAKKFKTQSFEKKNYSFPGGAKAWSSPSTAENIMDGNAKTWWSPDSKDPLDNWQIEIDLGRVVAAKKVRLVFADTLGMKPFERFSVYISEGARFDNIKDFSPYYLLGKAMLPNRERVVEYEMTFREYQDTTATGEGLTRTLNFNMVKFVRVVIDVPNQVGRPALAEVEVDAIGDNMALLTPMNGGSIVVYERSLELGPKIYDGDVGSGSYWGFTPVVDTEWDKGSGTGGKSLAAAFEWDLGATFWADQIFLNFGAYGYYAGLSASGPGSSGTASVPGYLLMTSDGSPRPGGVESWPPGKKYDYQLVTEVDNVRLPYQFRFSHEIERRKVRHLFFRVAHGIGYWGRGNATLYEIMIFGEGYPAEAELTSPPVDVGKLAGGLKKKLITGLRWEGEQPFFPVTRVEVQTRSGDTVDTLKAYYKKAGLTEVEVTEGEYYNLRPVQRGSIKTTGFKPGAGWSRWSLPYSQEGPFLSPSPTAFVQFQITLSTEQSDIAPVLKGLSVELTDPFVRRVTGAVSPREVREVDRPLPYTYTLWPEADSGDRGFDRVLIKAPGVGDTVRLEINGKAEPPKVVAFGRDSLRIDLPRLVKTDSVAVWFISKVSKNGVAVEAFVGMFSMPGVWQGVDSSSPGATLIFLPTLAESNDLIGNLRISRMFTPNEDGINDRAEIVFSLLKVEGKEPEVAIYDINGRLMKDLQKEKEGLYIWDGRDQSGDLVPPGVYLCRIQIKSDARNYTVHRTLGVVY